MSIRQQLAKSFMGVGAMRLLSIPTGLVSSIILARTLGPESFGQYAFVMALLPLLVLPVAGVPQLLTREVSGYSHAGKWSLYRGVVRGAHIWVVFVSLIVFVLYVTGGPFIGWIPTEGKWALLGIIILIVPINGLNAVKNGTIKGLGFPAYAELPSQLIQPVIVLVAYASLVSIGNLTSLTAVWAQVFGGAATFVFASILFFRIRPNASLSHQPIYEPKKWVASLFPFTLIVLVNTFNTQVGIVLLGVLGTDAAVAALRVGESGAMFVALSLTLVNMVISPHIVKAYRGNDIHMLQQLSRQSARVAFVIALPIGLILIFLGEPLVSLVFGEEYAVISYLPLVILVMGQLFSVFFGSVGQLLSMSGHERDTLVGQIVALVVNVVACVILIPLYGALGAAIGVSIGIVTWNVMLGKQVFKRLKIRPTAI